MKKILNIIVFLLVSISLTAGNVRIDKSDDVYYGGKKGDFSLSFSALPVLNFAGNMFNGTTSQTFTGFGSVTPSFFSGSSLSVKYFSSDKMSIIVGAGFNCLSNKTYSYDEDYQDKLNATTKGSNEVMFMLGANYLLRPGKRLQPVLGANLVYAHSNKNFEKIDDKEETNADTNHRSPQNTFGVIANLGVEFFFCRNVSMSAVLDLGLTRTTARSKADDWDAEHSYVTSRQTKFMTGKMGGNMALNFYF